MPIAGSRVGPYEIVGLIGAGGMGEVYRARDPRLGRDIALKILSPEFADDGERLRRFEQEARAAAALNHPNIVTIYSVEEADGCRFLTMELVDGRSLSELIEPGGWPLDRLLDVAIALADALAAAHAKGITHRDVKPANVMIASDGRVKILDFGLAKLLESSPVGVTTLPTDSLTGQGRIVGTIAYMSPEQAEGKPIDHRSDIFSLGVVLYELVTGRRPFVGESSVAILSSILKDTPPSITALRPTLRPDLGRIVGRAMNKDVERRYQTAKDVRNELEELKASSVSVAGTAGSQPLSATGPRRVPPWLLAGGAIALMGGLAGAAWFEHRSSISATMNAVPIEATFTQLTALKGMEIFPTLSPDGKWFVYTRIDVDANISNIYLQSVGGQTAIDLSRDKTAGDGQPAFSPDGERLAFRSDRAGGGLFVMSRTGDAVKRLTTMGFNPSWAPSGEEIVFAEKNVDINPLERSSISGLWVVSTVTGDKRRITAGDAVQPQWSPHGYRIAYWANRDGQRDIGTIPAGGGEPVFVTNDTAMDWNPIWSPDGRFLYFSSDRGGSMNLWRIGIDERSGIARGAPVPVTTPSRFVAHLSFSADGTALAYASIDVERNLHAFPFDSLRESIVGQPMDITSGSKVWEFVDVSSDGQWLALGSEGRQDLFVARRDGTGLRQLTSDGLHRFPHWSPDGARIAFSSRRSGATWDIWTISPDGSGLTQLTKRADAVYPIWSPDGTQMAYTDYRTNRVRVFDPRKPWESQTAETLPAAANWAARAWSADGKWLAGDLRSGGIVIYSIDTGSYEKLTSAGESAQWLSDSRRLLFASGGKLSIVDRQTKTIHDIVSEPGRESRVVSVPRDDRQLYVLLQSTEADVWMATFKPSHGPQP